MNLSEPEGHSPRNEGARGFHLQAAAVPDFVTTEGQYSPVHYLLYKIQLLLDSDPAVQTHDYELIKIAELLEATERQGAVLSKRYIPLCLFIFDAPPEEWSRRTYCNYFEIVHHGRVGMVLSSTKISLSRVNSRQTRQKCSCWSCTIPSKAFLKRGTTGAREPEGRKDEAA